MNLPNPKGESFDTEGIEGGRSIVASLKEKLARGFSQGITLGFFNSSNRARVFGSFFSLVIYIQKGSCTLSLMIESRMKISVSMDISVLGFFEYIGYIGDISVDIFT